MNEIASTSAARPAVTCLHRLHPLLLVLAKAAGYALLGGLVGSALGVSIGWGAGWLAGNNDGVVADGVHFGFLLAVLIGAVMTDSIESWPGKRLSR